MVMKKGSMPIILSIICTVTQAAEKCLKAAGLMQSRQGKMKAKTTVPFTVVRTGILSLIVVMGPGEEIRTIGF